MAVVFRDTLDVETLSIPSGDSQLESLWVSLRSTKSIIIGVIYRPPRAPVAPALDDLQTQIVHAASTSRPVYVLGDTNFDILKPSRPDVRNYLQMVNELEMKQLVTSQTRPTSGTLIDHILVRSTDDATTVRLEPCSWTDHDLLIAETPLVRERRRPPEVTIRSTRELVPDALCLDLLMSDWSTVYNSTDPDHKWKAWLTVWSPVIDMHMPLKTIKLRRPPAPWLTDDDDLRTLMRERDLADDERRAQPADEQATQRYRLLRNQVKSAQLRAKSAFFLASYRRSRRTTWADIRRHLISPAAAAAATPQAPRDPGWADRLNEHFATVGPRVAAVLEEVQREMAPLPPRPARVVSDAFRVRPVTLPELSSAIQRMSASRASGSDGVTIGMVRMTFPVIGPHLLDVINASLVSGKVPSDWKMANVIASHKSGSTDDPSNYRPLSLLSVVGKIAESIVCAQLMSYLLSNSILVESQHGFRPGRSTESAMLDAVSYLMDGLDKGLVGCLTTADTSKAFDSVQHPRLLEKLGWYSIDTHWFEDWLSDRRQVVRGGATVRPLTHGVIQGSLLGPILFLIYTNDLTSYLDSKVVMYADDVQFLHLGPPKEITALKAQVETTLQLANNWFVHNFLKINPTKTELLVIKTQRRQLNTEINVRFGDASIRPSTKAKILGVTVDPGLSFDSHVSTIIRRCYGTLGGLAKSAKGLPKGVKKLIVEMLIFPHIRYCMSVWSGCGKVQRHRLQKVINHCAQVVMGVRRSAHVTPLLQELGWQNIDELVKESDCSTLHYLLNNSHAPQCLTESFQRRSSLCNRETRATANTELQIPRTRTEHARNYFTCRSVRLWNTIPLEIRSARKSSACRRLYRKANN